MPPNNVINKKAVLILFMLPFPFKQCSTNAVTLAYCNKKQHRLTASLSIHTAILYDSCIKTASFLHQSCIIFCLFTTKQLPRHYFLNLQGHQACKNKCNDNQSNPCRNVKTNRHRKGTFHNADTAQK